MISLGVDLGGTGAKCAAFRDDGAQLAVSYIEYPNASGKVNLDPDVLTESVMNVIRDCVHEVDSPGEIKAITVASFGESFVPIDEHGKALTDIIMYFADSNSQAFSDLVERVGAEKFMRITGIRPDAQYSLSKMLYTLSLRDIRIWKFLFIAGFIAYRLCGIPATDAQLASRSLLFDVRRKCWSRELLDAAGISISMMPDILDPGTILGRLLPHVAERLGLTADVSVVMGTHDQIVNALACGMRCPGEAMDGSGTSECIVPLFSRLPESEEAFAAANYACIPYLDGKNYVTYAYNTSGGAVVKWYRDCFAQHLRPKAAEENVSIYDILNRTCPAEPTQLIVLPYLTGMGGTPDIVSSARGMIYGLTTNTRPGDVYRAILEGLTFEMRYNLDCLKRFGIRPARIYACGGGARSRVWLQIKADIFNCEVVPVLTRETGALGCAILGMAAVMGEKDCCRMAERFVRTDAPVVPNRANAEIYLDRFGQFRQLREYIRQR